jgi:hypothetical protein
LRNGFAIVTCVGPAASPDLHLTITFRCAPLLLHLKRLTIPNDQGWILLALGTPESKLLTKVSCPA